MEGASVSRHVLRHRAGETEESVDRVVSEQPLEIRLDGTPLAVLMRTPGHEEDLIRGFALTEGMVVGPDEIAGVDAVGGEPEDARWELRLRQGVMVDSGQFQRNLYATSSCGVCGKASIDAVRVSAPSPPSGPVLGAAQLLALPAKMRAEQQAFAATGGLHAAALFDPEEGLLDIREDIGRHNAVDKVIGAVTMGRWPLGEVVLLVSGRVSFEMVQKAAVAGVPVVCGVSAASSLAIELGEELDVTVVGFLRDDGFNVYTGERRIRA